MYSTPLHCCAMHTVCCITYSGGVAVSRVFSDFRVHVYTLRACIRVYVHTSARVYACIHILVRVYTRVFACQCPCVRVFMHASVRVYAHMHTSA